MLFMFFVDDFVHLFDVFADYCMVLLVALEEL